ncbi:MAG: hypothetical protein KJP00_13485, partial [Bacteroidia bacterium]|nr:hypothetical protein [Bacteroidia bacterium]
MARLSTVLILLFASLFSSSVFANTCEGPDSINALIVQADNVLLNWEPKASSYTIEYGLTGFVPGSGSQESTADTSIRIQSLVEKSVYDFYLISDCGGGMLDTIGPKIIETLYYNDIGISLLNAPQTACDLTNMEDITISISNYGQNPQQLFDFGYSLDFVEQEVNRPFDGFYTGVVGYDSTVMTTFDIKAPIGIPGKYIFQVWTDLQEDSDNDNDTLTVEVFHQPVINDYPYEWDFEEWEGGWVIHDSVSSNSSLQYGRPNSPEIQSAYSGTKAWVTNLIGDYNANERSILISPCFDFSNMVNDPYMSFALHYQGEACCDFSQAEISINGGLNWTKIGDGENGIN